MQDVPVARVWRAPTETGTPLECTESGFDKVPEDRRALAFRLNDGRWSQQRKNIERHVLKR